MRCGKCEQLKQDIEDLKIILENHMTDEYFNRIHDKIGELEK